MFNWRSSCTTGQLNVTDEIVRATDVRKTTVRFSQISTIYHELHLPGLFYEWVTANDQVLRERVIVVRW